MAEHRQLTQERLNELSELPRCKWQDVLSVTGELPAEDAATMDRYFSNFVVMEDGKCVNCGLTQGGLMAALLGGFTWGLVHGEGFCSRCKYPARALHYDVGPIKRMEAILQYHPSGLQSALTEEEVAEPANDR